MTVGGIVLPRFGWRADGAGVHAWTGRKDGALADYAETADRIFANARTETDWLSSGVLRIRPEVAKFEQTGPRAFRVTYSWTAGEKPPAGASVFVHFVLPGGANEGIRLQNDHPLPASDGWTTSRPTPDGPFTVQVPETAPDGSYQWYIGLFSPGEGRRFSLEGVDDGHGRIRLGQLIVSDGGKSLRFVPEPRSGDDRQALYRADLNAVDRVVDFGPVKTDGSVLVERRGRGWKLLVYPRTRAFTVLLSSRRFGSPGMVRCEGGSSASTAPQPAGAYWRLPLTGASSYEWDGEPSRNSSK